MGGSMFSGSSQRRAAMQTAIQQQTELDKQKAVAEDSQVASMQSTLSRDTNRLLRVYNTRSLLSASGLRAPAAVA